MDGILYYWTYKWRFIKLNILGMHWPQPAVSGVRGNFIVAGGHLCQRNFWPFPTDKEPLDRVFAVSPEVKTIVRVVGRWICMSQ